MDLKEILPKNGPQRAYCDTCSGGLELVFEVFDEDVSGIAIKIDGLPMLRCFNCNEVTLPDRSRFALMKAHEQAAEAGSQVFKCNRVKIEENFGYTETHFQYDPDDYYYYPGLFRSTDIGFLTPVFFNRDVLVKYDAHPSYMIRYASPTYGEIIADEISISFVINRNGLVLMWLGDISTLPTKEQKYLLSENVPSDHCIASEFYDGQIEAIFTDPTNEMKLFSSRSSFLERSFKRWGVKIAHLDQEVLELAETLVRPQFDTKDHRRDVADALYKVHVESIDNKEIAKLLDKLRVEASGSRSLKRLEALLGTEADKDHIGSLMSPLYTLGDFRNAYSHFGSNAGRDEQMTTVTERLELEKDAELSVIYDELVSRLTRSYDEFAKLL